MKTLLTTLLIISALAGYSQKITTDDAYYSPKMIQRDKKIKADNFNIDDKDQTARIIRCLDSYHNERKLAMVFTLAGAGLGGYHLSQDEPKNNIVPIVSVGLLAVGTLIFIDAEHWLSKRSLTFTGNKLAYHF